jgi:2-keto-4-pentenoate hydratase/2-oxohepta-3-ene-1,7-dioic acid hydratase in catechol pathway
MLLCTGSNYRDHVEEHEQNAVPTNAPRSEFEFFIKAGQTIAALDDPLILDAVFGAKIDQETELGLVIGPGCPRGVSEAAAADYIFGYLVVNDITARDKQVRLTDSGGAFMVLGASKNFEGSTRLSSYIVTADEIPDLYNLALQTRVNGGLTQNNSTANVINNFSLIVSTFASGLSLQPGGIISTGTPGGTGWGQDRDLGGRGFVPPGCSPARYLQPGDRVESSIEGVGTLHFETADPSPRAV